MAKYTWISHRWLGAVAAALALGACTGSDGKHGSDGKKGADALVVTAPEPAGANCAAGGTAIRAGVDRDDDGTLDAAEVSSTSYLCDGPRGNDGNPGAASLVDAVDVTDGSCGAPGGRIVRWGLDDVTRNGLLDAGEVDGTTKLCSGAVGTRVVASPAPWGDPCERGGVKIDSWVDVDGDGALNGAEQLLAPQYVCNVFAKAIAAGGQQTCSVMSDGSVRCAGFVDGADRDVAVTIPGVAGATAVTSGFAHACARLADASVVCWGDNTFGQLGVPPTDPPTSIWTPQPIAGIGDAVAIEAKADHTCALRSTGTVACWGDNLGGVLGTDPATAFSEVPIEIAAFPAGFVATELAVGVQHACATDHATIHCWGANFAGQLGVHPDTTPALFSAEPVEVALATALEPSLAIAAGEDFTCSVGAASNNVVCWGFAGDDRLGFLAPPELFSISGDVAALFGGAVDVAAGADHACAIMVDGTVHCWGANGFGQLGIGTTSTLESATPVQGLANVAEVTAGSGAACALDFSGTAWCWGANTNGRLGIGTPIDALFPVPVVGGLAP